MKTFIAALLTFLAVGGGILWFVLASGGPAQGVTWFTGVAALVIILFVAALADHPAIAGLVSLVLLLGLFFAGDIAAVIVLALGATLFVAAIVSDPMVGGYGEFEERHFYDDRHVTRALAAERFEQRTRHSEWLRLERVALATENIPTTWLIDAFDAPESTPRDDMLAALDADTAWALARLHRKGVPAEYVAARWTNGEPLDADALVASYREGGAA